MTTAMLPSEASWSVVTAVVLGILLLVKVLTGRKYKNLPPGPPCLPIIGNLHLVTKYPPRGLGKLAETYGPDLMSIWMGPKLIVLASSPAAAEEVLKIQGPNFSNRMDILVKDILLPKDIVMAMDTPRRLHMKKILQTQLATTRQVQLTSSVRTEELEHLLRSMPRDGVTVAPVRTYIDLVTTNVMSRMIVKKRFMAVVAGQQEDPAELDPRELEQVTEFREIADELARYVQGFNPQDFLPVLKWIDYQGFQRRFRELRARMDSFMSTVISEHVEQRKSGSSAVKDLVDIFLDQIEDENLRFNIDDVHVNSALWNSFAASTSALSDTIEWCMAECINNPHVIKRAQEELDRVVGKSRRVEDSDIPNLKYLQAIVKENFRLHPIGPMLAPHVTKNACKVLGYDIPENTPFFVNVGAIGRIPSIWKEPLVFKPERFFGDTPHANMTYDGKHFDYLPFGSGPRRCPGIVLAGTVVHILVATLLQFFDWSLPNGLPNTDLDMSEAEGILHIKAHPLEAIPKARLSIASIIN